MTVSTTASSGLPRPETIARTLRAAHEIWLGDTEALLNPLLTPGTGFWERWTAVRCLADEFIAHHNRERALLKSVEPFLSGVQVDQLQREGRRVAELQQLLDQIGRQGADVCSPGFWSRPADARGRTYVVCKSGGCCKGNPSRSVAGGGEAPAQPPGAVRA